MVARFLDPLGIVTPVTILFKMFFQQLCEVGVGWDNPLTDDLLEKRRQHSSLSGAKAILSFEVIFLVNQNQVD